jgi:predicted aspartyl protease
MSLIVQAGWFMGLAIAAAAETPPLPPTSPTGQFHRLKLKPFVIPPEGAIGLLIVARVNDGPPLRLLLDSGAQFLVLDKKAAGRSGCAGGSSMDLIGAGSALPRTARTVTANAVQTGDIVLRQVRVVIVERQIVDSIDGVLPLALFADYIVRLDFPARNLDLIPYSNEPVAPSSPGSHAVVDNNLLFVKGTVNDTYEGYFILDTGASYNAISMNLARRMRSSAALTNSVSLQGGTAQMYAHRVTEILRFTVGASELQTDPVLAVDLSLASRYHNREVSGLLGYPALRNSVVTLNYRKGLVQIDRK